MDILLTISAAPRLLLNKAKSRSNGLLQCPAALPAGVSASHFQFTTTPSHSGSRIQSYPPDRTFTIHPRSTYVISWSPGAGLLNRQTPYPPRLLIPIGRSLGAQSTARAYAIRWCSPVRLRCPASATWRTLSLTLGKFQLQPRLSIAGSYNYSGAEIRGAARCSLTLHFLFSL